ncbi:hypothetical protein [uncultured Ilyobacter sp.]|uniref:hypothetical protein n=1 Tax=uncultured Ilyobacter sp. TaxID=544433 RepID=UPI0029C7241C|nr:hypothetical protein [uncultured Ilyobacter sp.]
MKVVKDYFIEDEIEGFKCSYEKRSQYNIVNLSIEVPEGIMEAPGITLGNVDTQEEFENFYKTYGKYQLKKLLEQYKRGDF